MTTKHGFLDIIESKHGDGQYAGDEFGGAAGSDGSGLPDGYAGAFLFATGIECSYPTIDNGRIRRDLLEECRHYECWRGSEAGQGTRAEGPALRAALP